MSETKEEKTTKIEKVPEKPSKLLAYPQFCATTNDEETGYDVEIYLPGVEKDTINLKVNEDFIYVTGETETVRYSGMYSLCCPIDPEKTTSSYKEGLLKVHVPFKEIELSTVDVNID